jgi:hypothetical protein
MQGTKLLQDMLLSERPSEPAGGLMQPIAEWLEQLGLADYARLFNQNGVDLSEGASSAEPGKIQAIEELAP